MIEKTYDSLFTQITKLNTDDLIVNKKCKFCLHPKRSEAELLYEKTGSCPPVHKYLNKLHEEDPTQYALMTTQNIRTHLVSHYSLQERKVWLREYGDRFQEFMNYKVSKDRMFEGLAAALEMKFLEVASDLTLCPVKQTDAMTKISKMLVEIVITQAKLKGELKTVNVVMEKFMNIWVHLIGQQKDETIRHQLMNALDTFQEQMEGVALSDD